MAKQGQIFKKREKLWCKHCEVWHPRTPEFYNFRPDGSLWMCKEGNRKRVREAKRIKFGHTPHEVTRALKEAETFLKSLAEERRKNFKVCSSCCRELPRTTEFFHVNNYQNRGFQNYCKECRRMKDRESRRK